MWCTHQLLFWLLLSGWWGHKHVQKPWKSSGTMMIKTRSPLPFVCFFLLWVYPIYYIHIYGMVFFSKCSSTPWLPSTTNMAHHGTRILFQSRLNKKPLPPAKKKTEMWLNFAILEYIRYLHNTFMHMYIYIEIVLFHWSTTLSILKRPRKNNHPSLTAFCRGCTICIEGVEERSWGAFEGADDDVFFFFFLLDMVGWWIRRKDVGYGWWLWWFLDDGWWWRGCIC